MEGKETYLIICNLCEAEIGYDEHEDDGCAMCLDCYYKKTQERINTMQTMQTMQTAKTLYDFEQAPNLEPNIIPKGSIVEVLKEVHHNDFLSGIGYIIFWPEKAYADVVDKLRLEFIDKNE